MFKLNKSKLSVQLRQFSVEGSEYPQTNLRLSFGTTKMAAYVNKNFVCFVRKKIWTCLLGWYYKFGPSQN